MRVRAPELRGRGWLNTGGEDLSLKGLRGKIVILDFWTFCCVNCLHVLDELRPLEQKFGDVLVVVGVHSPKFEHEKDPAALVAAAERYGVAHPVLDDPELVTWRQYAAKAWPTLCVVDPEGYLVASMAGEGHAEGLFRLIEQLVGEHEAKGTLHRGDGPFVPPPTARTPLRFPGKALALPTGGLLVSDSSRHSLVELAADAQTPVRRIGSGTRGRADGGPTTASFSEPQGLALLPPEVAGTAGYDVVVADTVNHLLRGVRLDSGEVRAIAGTGQPWRSTVEGQPQDALGVDLSSPWDVAWYDDRVIIAMAGIHQLWWFDPIRRTAGVFAGTTVEALRDGPLPDVWLAQPSGLSVSPDGRRLWLADAETSALRVVEPATDTSAELVLRTVVGQGLFDFGHVDGPAAEALMQHPLGVCALADGSVLVADTYNGAVRRYADGRLTTVETGLAEPSDVVLDEAGSVLVVESAAHRLVRLAAGTALAGSTVHADRHTVERPPTTLRSGPVTLEIIFTSAPGQKLDEAYGPSTRLEVSASPPELLLDGSGTTTSLTRALTLNPAVTRGVLQVVAQAATCDVDAVNPACHLTRQDWGVPIEINEEGAARLPLILRGLDQ
jgi:thiol-disulfide isomerase/thioredoxin